MLVPVGGAGIMEEDIQEPAGQPLPKRFDLLLIGDINMFNLNAAGIMYHHFIFSAHCANDVPPFGDKLRGHCMTKSM